MSAHFDRDTFNDRLNKAWWNPDRFDPISADMDCQLENAAATMVGVGSVGDIDVSFVQFTALFAGVPDQLFGDIDAELEEPTCTGVCIHYENVGFLEATFEQPQLEVWPGIYILCTFEPATYDSSFFIPGEVMDNCTFKALEFNGSATSFFSSLEVNAKWFDCSMYIGNAMDCRMEKLQTENYAFVSIQGHFKGSIRRLEFDGIGGKAPYVDAVFEKPTYSMNGSTPIRANLKLTSLLGSCLFSGRIGNFGWLETSMIPLFISGWTGKSSPRGSLEVQMAAFSMIGSGITGAQGELLTNFELMTAELSEGAVTSGDLNLEAEVLDLEMLSGGNYYPGGGGTCEEPATLEFGVC